MELLLTGTNMPITPAIRAYVERKLGKLSRHMPNILDTKVEISEEQTRDPRMRYWIKVTVGAGRAVMHGEERAEDVFIAIDRVADVMIRQLEHHKGKLYEKGRGEPSIRVVEAEAAAASAPPAEPRVVKTKRFLLKPMTEQEAISAMESLGHNFYLFLDAATKQTRVLYRRKDGNYGLIEAESG